MASKTTHLIAPFIIALFLLFAELLGVASPVHTIADYAVVPVKKTFFTVRMWGVARLSGFVAFGSLQKKLSEKERQLASVLVDKTEFERLRKENDVLRKQLEIGFPRSSVVIAGRVTGFEKSTITLDVGSRQGVSSGMAVIAENTMIGVVDNVFANSSVVKLLHHEDTKIAAQTSAGARGLVVGDHEKIFLEKVSSVDSLGQGELVITSGSETIPGDLVIGSLEAVSFSEQELFKRAVVVPPISYNTVQFVFVVGR